MNRLPLLLALVFAGCVVVERPAPRAYSSPASSDAPVSPAPREYSRPTTPTPVAPLVPPAPTPVVYAVPAPAPVVVAEFPPIPEADIVVVYEDLLGRRPSERELREWRSRTRAVRMSANDVQHEIRASMEYQALAPESVIRRAYRDFQRGEPDTISMRYYRRRMIDEGWSAGRVRQSIAHDGARASSTTTRGEPRRHGRGEEGQGRSRGYGPEERETHSPDAIIDRAYDDLLERDPDPAGRDRYRRLLRQGWSEKQLRAQIKESLEYRVTLPDSKTTRAYREVLGREPDPVGLEGFRHKLVDSGWTEEDVKNYLRQTDEYKKRRQ